MKPTFNQEEVRLSFWLGFGAGSGALTVLLCLMAIGSTTFLQKSLYDFLKDWQTLIAGLVALFTGLLAVHAIRLQIFYAQHAAIDQQERASFAHRSRLPIALARLSDYCEEVIEILKRVWENRGERGELLREMPELRGGKPKLPASELDVICAAIESENLDVREALAELVEMSQIQNSRFEHECDALLATSMSASINSIENRIIDALRLKCYCDKFFGLARRKNNQRPSLPNGLEILQVAELKGITKAEHPEVYEELKKPNNCF